MHFLPTHPPPHSSARLHHFRVHEFLNPSTLPMHAIFMQVYHPSRNIMPVAIPVPKLTTCFRAHCPCPYPYSTTSHAHNCLQWPLRHTVALVLHGPEYGGQWLGQCHGGIGGYRSIDAPTRPRGVGSDTMGLLVRRPNCVQGLSFQ